ncbi:hypothetical protein HK101_005447, partial [Irineochytrium annulatum]
MLSSALSHSTLKSRSSASNPMSCRPMFAAMTKLTPSQPRLHPTTLASASPASSFNSSGCTALLNTSTSMLYPSHSAIDTLDIQRQPYFLDRHHYELRCSHHVMIDASRTAESPPEFEENEGRIHSTAAKPHTDFDSDEEKIYSAKLYIFYSKNIPFSGDSKLKEVLEDDLAAYVVAVPVRDLQQDADGKAQIAAAGEDTAEGGRHAEDEGDKKEEFLDDDELCDRRRRHHRSAPACWEDDFDVFDEDGEIDGNEGSAAVGATDAGHSAEAREATTATSPGVPHYGTDLDWAQVEVEDHEGVWIAEVVEVGILIVRPLSDEVLEPEEHAALPPQSCHLLQVPSIDYSVGRMYLDDEVRYGYSGTPPGERRYLFQS